ncbi:hypothetical protein NDU88_000574 [Pleurodeles waltl]|uniref:Uncharacterized protein n=1 Tax=Pleurodeles waltl TaxID=8319 RepID=A0AAV7UTS3_PLEWA|nr:hypothetical protein NDU88_000574 [Pleurodeles waltl]
MVFPCAVSVRRCLPIPQWTCNQTISFLIGPVEWQKCPKLAAPEAQDPLLLQLRDTAMHRRPAGSHELGGSKHPQRLLSVSPAPSVSEGPRPCPRPTARRPFLSRVALRLSLTRLCCSSFARSQPLLPVPCRPVFCLSQGLLDPLHPRADHQPEQVCPTAHAHAFQFLRSGTLQDAQAHQRPPADPRREEDTNLNGEHKAGDGPPPPSSTSGHADQLRAAQGGPPARSQAARSELQKWGCHAEGLLGNDLQHTT